MTKTIQYSRLAITIFLFLSCSLSYAKSSLDDFSRAQHNSLQKIIETSLYGDGLETFDTVSSLVKNNIQWSNRQSTNRYIKAHRRCLPFLKRQTEETMPAFVFLIAYLESGWRAKVGNPLHDYGYWQMIPEVVKEIRHLPEASEKLKSSSLRRIRSHKKLSTEAAFIHLHRYYFYFRHVANFDEPDAWMFTLVAFNWGSGNVKRMLMAMEEEDIDLSFSNFYYYLFEQSQDNKKDKSMRVAVEYIPNIWNIALLLTKKK